MVEPVTELVLEAPAGLVRVRAECSGGVVERIDVRERAVVRAPPSTRPSRSPGLGSSAVDVAYGGAFCAFVDAAALGLLDRARRGARRWPTSASGSGRTSTEQVTIDHPLSGSHLSFVVFVAPPRVGGDARHATIVSPGRLDRSPTGTATSARIAVLDRPR